MVESKNYAWNVNAVSKDVYFYFETKVNQLRQVLEKKKIVVFGAGIRGNLLAMILEKNGFYSFCFTDNNGEKWGGNINGHDILPVSDVYDKIGEVYVLIAIEGCEKVVLQLEKNGFQEGENYTSLDTSLYDLYMKEFLRKYDGKVLVFGDCGLTHISLSDSDDCSMGEMLKQSLGGELVKILAMHGMGIHSFYHILKTQVFMYGFPETLVMMINFDTLTGKQHLLPRSQHLNLLERIYQYSGEDEEFEAYLQVVRERSENFQIELVSENGEHGYEERLKLYLRLNYMYRLKKDNENLVYLERTLQWLGQNGVRVITYIPPVNYQLAERLGLKNFQQRYQSNLDILFEILNKYRCKVLDFSYLLPENEFSTVTTADETANYVGRQKQVENLVRELRGGAQECSCVVTNTSKPLYDAVYRAAKKYRKLLGDRKTVIYGAGIRGNLIAVVLENVGWDEFYFCDQNPFFEGKTVRGHSLISREELYKNSQQFFIFVSPENAKDILEDFSRHGLKQNRDFVWFGGVLYQAFLDSLKREQNDGVLMLGDCDLLACSLAEQQKICLGELLMNKFADAGIDYKQLAMNAITIGGLYWSYHLNRMLGNRAEFVFICVDLRNFNGINHCLAAAQHTDLLDEMQEIITDEAFSEYVTIAKERFYKSCKIVKTGKAGGTGREAQAVNANYIRLNYCYRLRQDNEELEYLLRLLKEICANGERPVLVFMPVNYEKAEEYCPQKFREFYEWNRKQILDWSREFVWDVLDLSFCMGKENFPVDNTFDECLGIAAKQKIADVIYEKYLEVKKENEQKSQS